MRYRGILVGDWKLPPGKVTYNAAFEEVLAWRWAGETAASYAALDDQQRAVIKAAYRSQTKLEAIEHHEHQKSIRNVQRRQAQHREGS